MSASLTRPVVVGRVNGVFGTRGWVKVYSHTRPRENLLDYRPWYLRDADGAWCRYDVRAAQRRGAAFVAALDGVEDRDAATALLRRDIAVDRSQLAPADEGEYYWSDLTGLDVVNAAGEVLGVVDGLLETAAHDVLRVRGERERLIPFVRGVYVLDVDLDARRIRVDWHADD